MNRLIIALTVAGLGTILVPVSAHAGRIAFDRSGNLIVAEGNTILKFTPDGERSTFASGVGHTVELTFDDNGNLFVWDGNTILKFTPDGKKSTFASGLVPDTWDLALDRSGNLFVTDHVSRSILKFTPDGKKSTFASGLAAEHLTLDRSGNLFVTDKGSDSILKFTSDGKRSMFASGYVRGDLTFDDKSNLFVTVLVRESSSYSILKFTPEGVKSSFATGLNHPSDHMAFDRSGNLFVTDSGSILKFTPDGKKSTFGISYFPSELAFDAAGNLFVFESASDLIFKFTPDGTRSTLVSDRVSPDKQWEFHFDDRIVKAGTTQTVLDLSESGPENAKIVWAPDSKRFALNYSQTCKHCTYDTIAFYQLREDKWVALRSLVDERSERGQLAQLAKDHLPKSAHERRIWRSQPTHDLLKVREWIDANTAILYAYSQWFLGGDLKANFLFTMKFDTEGNWKIVKTHQMSENEVEKEDAGEDVSRPAQTTDLEGVGGDASFRDADRRLNEVYNALRARFSPSARDSLKKEQLAWLDQRNAAVQDAKKNAQENPTDGADREVTKMTQARVVELEKRLKKAK